MTPPKDRGSTCSFSYNEGRSDRNVRSILGGLTNLTLSHHLIRKDRLEIVRHLGIRQDALWLMSRGVAPIHVDSFRNASCILSAGIRDIFKRRSPLDIEMLGSGDPIQPTRQIRKTDAAVAHF